MGSSRTKFYGTVLAMMAMTSLFMQPGIPVRDLDRDPTDVPAQTPPSPPASPSPRSDLPHGPVAILS